MVAVDGDDRTSPASVQNEVKSGGAQRAGNFGSSRSVRLYRVGPRKPTVGVEESRKVVQVLHTIRYVSLPVSLEASREVKAAGYEDQGIPSAEACVREIDFNGWIGDRRYGRRIAASARHANCGREKKHNDSVEYTHWQRAPYLSNRWIRCA